MATKPTPEDDADAKALADLEVQEAAIKANQAARDAEIQANATAQAGMQTSFSAPKPFSSLKVVDLDEQGAAQTAPTGNPGQSFFFGDVNLLKFPDGSTYHVQRQHATIFDPKIIANLLEASKNPALKIFPE